MFRIGINQTKEVPVFRFYFLRQYLLNVYGRRINPVSYMMANVIYYNFCYGNYIIIRKILKKFEINLVTH